jgi:hypothetical protein
MPIGVRTTAARRETSEASGNARASVAKPMRRSRIAASAAGSIGPWLARRTMNQNQQTASPDRAPEIDFR